MFGGPPNVLPSGTLAVDAGQRRGRRRRSAFDASSFTDPDSKITGYDWDFDGNGTVDRTTDVGPRRSSPTPPPGSFTAKVAVKDFRGGAGEGSAPVTVTGGAGSPGAPGGPAGPGGGPGGGGAPPAPVVAPGVQLPRSGSGGRLRFTVSCPLDCTVSGKLTLTAGQARKLHLKRLTLRRFSRTLKADREQPDHRQRAGPKPSARPRATASSRLTAALAVNATQADHQDKVARRTVRIRL